MENIIRIADDFAKQYKLTLPLRLDTMRRLCDALGYKLLTYAEGAAILENCRLMIIRTARHFVRA